MIIGLDLDNTIVSYENAIVKIADEFTEIPNHIAKNKDKIKGFFIENNLEKKWTFYQGELYGPGMKYAKPYPGVIDFIKQVLVRDHKICIISHRSKKPYGGQDYNLHIIARNWINMHLPYQESNQKFSIYILETLEKKIRFRYIRNIK